MGKEDRHLARFPRVQHRPHARIVSQRQDLARSGVQCRELGFWLPCCRRVSPPGQRPHECIKYAAPGCVASCVRVSASTLHDTWVLWVCADWVQTGGLPFSTAAPFVRDLRVVRARTRHPTTSVRARVQIPANWSVPGVVSNYGWLEGNAVAGPGGVVYDVLRVNSVPTANKAALVRVNSPTSPPVFDRCDLRTCLLVSYALHTCAPREPWCGFHGRFIDFPGGMTKFTIRYDPTTKLWVTLANTVTDASIWPNPGCTFTKAGGAAGVSSSAPQPCCGATALVTCHDCLWCRAQSRNLLTLNTSPDLVNWSVRATIMSDDTGFQPWSSMLYTGFQYVLRLAPTRMLATSSQTGVPDTSTSTSTGRMAMTSSHSCEQGIVARSAATMRTVFCLSWSRSGAHCSSSDRPKLHHNMHVAFRRFCARTKLL